VEYALSSDNIAAICFSGQLFQSCSYRNVLLLPVLTTVQYEWPPCPVTILQQTVISANCSSRVFIALLLAVLTAVELRKQEDVRITKKGCGM
jgi:hypothetical protein